MSYLKSISLLGLMMLGIIYGCNRNITSSQNETDSAQVESSESGKVAMTKTEPLDTVYSDGWLMVDNPHPKVKSAWFSKPNDRRDADQFRITFVEDADLGESEALSITKQLIGFNDNYDSLERTLRDGYDPEHYRIHFDIYHKKVPIEKSTIGLIVKSEKFTQSKGIYPRGLDIDVKNIISPEEAIEIAKKNCPSSVYQWDNPAFKGVRVNPNWSEYTTKDWRPIPDLQLAYIESIGYKYAYKILLSGDECVFGFRYVDAVDGNFLKHEYIITTLE